MIRAILVGSVLAAVAASAQDAVPKYRLRIGETTNAWVWRETMTDGTVRESQTPKPQPIPQPVRVSLVASNDVGFAWRYDYEVGRDDGSVLTNSSFRAKPPRERLAGKLSLERPPMPPDPVADAREYVAAARDLRTRAAEMTLERVAPQGVVTQRMARRVFVQSSRLIDRDRAELRHTDGSVTTQAVRRVVGKRLAALDAALAARRAPDPEPVQALPIDAGRAAAAAAGAIAGAAAAAALRKNKSH